MSNLLIRNPDEAVIADYRAHAKATGRSLQAELKEGLARGRPRGRPATDELIELSKRLTAMSPCGKDSTDYIRSIRDADESRYLGHKPGHVVDRP